MRNGGICGSDLHYFHAGRVGDFVIREPLVPGHEFSGEVAEIGRGRDPGAGRRPGGGASGPQLRALCALPGRAVQSVQNVFFMGSASKFPHMQGGFRERVVRARRASAIP